MKTSLSFPIRGLMGIAVLFTGAGLCAAPLTWFPGPSLNEPISGAATFVSAGNNVLIGGTSFYSPSSYPQSLAATNSYWSFLPVLYSVSIAGGALGNGDPYVVYGGSDGTNSTSATIAYSPSGDTLPPLASMRVARSYPGYAPDPH